MHPLLLKVRHELIICQCFFHKTHGTDWWWQENYTVLCVFVALSPINAFRVAWRLSSVIWWCGLLKSYIVHIVGVCKGFIFHLNCSLIWYKIMFPFLSLQLFIPEFVWAKGHPKVLTWTNRPIWNLSKPFLSTLPTLVSFLSLLLYNTFKSQALTPATCYLRDQKAQKYCNLFPCLRLTIIYHMEMFLLPLGVKEAGRVFWSVQFVSR